MPDIQRRALRTFDTSGLTANFQDVGAVISFPAWRAIFINPSDVDVLITDQSSEEDIRVPSLGTVNISELSFANSNKRDLPLFQGNTQLQVKQVTGAGTGTLIIILLGR